MTKNYFTTSVSHSVLAAAMAVGVVTAIAGMAAPAFADVDVTVSIAKVKTIFVDENITIDKDVRIDIIIGDVLVLDPTTGDPIGFKLEGLGAAEAQALANVENTDNVTTLEHVAYSAELDNSMSGNTGITQFNQAAGNMQNQGNLVAAAVTAVGDAFANAQTEVDQFNGDGIDGGEGNTNGNFVSAKDSSFTASIGAGSLSGNTGIVQLNQDAGNHNNQTNAVALAAGVETEGLDVVVALSEAALGQESSDNIVIEGGGTDLVAGPGGTFEDSTFKSATIDGALNGNTGAVIGINQAAGNNVNQGNLVSVASFVDF